MRGKKLTKDKRSFIEKATNLTFIDMSLKGTSLKYRICYYGAGILAVLFLCLVLITPAGVPILEYHKVNDATDDVYTVPVKKFTAQMDYLLEAGYTPISLLDFLRARKGKQQLPDRPIIITFDDGYEDNYTTMLPVLEARGMKATLFMVTNDIGQPGYLTWDQLRDMQERGIEIGSHTANHQPLPTLDDAQANDEIKLSKLLLEWNGIHTVFGFSYPNGAYDDRLPAMLQQNEYLAAVTGDAGFNTFETNPYLMQRTNIPRPRFGLMEFRLRLFKAELFAHLGIEQHRNS